eukprot:IDg18386t1
MRSYRADAAGARARAASRRHAAICEAARLGTVQYHGSPTRGGDDASYEKVGAHMLRDLDRSLLSYDFDDRSTNDPSSDIAFARDRPSRAHSARLSQYNTLAPSLPKTPLYSIRSARRISLSSDSLFSVRLASALVVCFHKPQYNLT